MQEEHHLLDRTHFLLARPYHRNVVKREDGRNVRMSDAKQGERKFYLLTIDEVHNLVR